MTRESDEQPVSDVILNEAHAIGRRALARAGHRLMNILFNYSRSPAAAHRATREANLIARNLECRGASAAAAQTADHIRRFWAPQLRSALFEQAQTHPERFLPIARDAIAMLIKSAE